jgi:hypothetical protein
MNKVSEKQPSKQSFQLTKIVMFSHTVILFENAPKGCRILGDSVAYYTEIKGQI